MTREKIRQWSKDTNGEENALSEDSIDEIFEFMDVDEANNLTFVVLVLLEILKVTGNQFQGFSPNLPTPNRE